MSVAGRAADRDAGEDPRRQGECGGVDGPGDEEAERERHAAIVTIQSAGSFVTIPPPTHSKGERMSAFLAPRRLLLAGAIVLGIAAAVILPAAGSVRTAQAQAATNTPLCVLHSQLCAEANNPWTWNGYTYVSGHDEPSLLFYSNKPGSGNSNEYQLSLPTDPPAAPAHRLHRPAEQRGLSVSPG